MRNNRLQISGAVHPSPRHVDFLMRIDANDHARPSFDLCHADPCHRSPSTDAAMVDHRAADSTGRVPRLLEK
jgi:hypothetical protein